MDKYMLCNPEDCKTLLATTAPSYNQNDPILRQCIVIATAMIESWTGRKFVKRTYTEVLRLPKLYGNPFRVHLLGAPIVDGSLQAKFSHYSLTSWDNVDPMEAGEFDIQPGATYGTLNLVACDNPFIRVTYQAGFDVLPNNGGQPAGYQVYDAPFDLQMACAIQAGFLAQRFQAGDTGKRGDEGSTVAAESVKNLVPDASKLIAGWRVMSNRLY